MDLLIAFLHKDILLPTGQPTMHVMLCGEVSKIGSYFHICLQLGHILVLDVGYRNGVYCKEGSIAVIMLLRENN